MLVAFGMIKKQLAMVPIPSCINYLWNFGSLLGVSLVVQILSGLMLSFSYEVGVCSSFSSIVHICHDVPGGWLFRYVHANGASFFFTLMYIHIGRGMYFAGYKNKLTWLLGVTILLVSMVTAFLGYVLPWGQMSLWGATVITNLLSAVPYVGMDMTIWLWGGFSVGGPALTRFFSLHFILPFVILFMVMVHVLTLHDKGSSNPLGVSEQVDKITFHPYFTYKDLMGVVVFMCLMMVLVALVPDMFMDPDNSVMANPLVTPPHIQPEWYFLFAYAILRSIPSKLGGVVGLLMSVAILYLYVFKRSNVRYSLCNKVMVVTIFTLFGILTWVGTMPAAYPLVDLGKLMSVLYFSITITFLLM